MPVYKRVDKNFFKIWGPEMAYTLGFFAADGNMIKTKRDTHFISFHSADEELLYRIRESMNSEHHIARRTATTGSDFRLQIGSKVLFQDLEVMGFSPLKTRRLKLPEVPSVYFSDFVRGYFDGDGNVWMGKINKKREKPTTVLQVAFTSGCTGFLEELWSALKAVGVSGGSLYCAKSRNYARLAFGTRDSLKLNEIMYNGRPKLHLERKRLRFEEFKKLRV